MNNANEKHNLSGHLLSADPALAFPVHCASQFTFSFFCLEGSPKVTEKCMRSLPSLGTEIGHLNLHFPSEPKEPSQPLVCERESPGHHVRAVQRGGMGSALGFQRAPECPAESQSNAGSQARWSLDSFVWGRLAMLSARLQGDAGVGVWGQSEKHQRAH